MQARSRFGVDITHARSPLVGRGRELELLVVRARAGPRGAHAAARDPRRRAGDRQEPPRQRVLAARPTASRASSRWRQGRSLSYGEGVSFWAAGEIVKAEAGILETDTAEEATMKLAAAVARLVPDEAEARWVTRHLAPLAGVGRRRGSGRPARRGIRGLAALLRRARQSSGRSCSSSRTCTGPTRACSTSSTAGRSAEGRSGARARERTAGAARRRPAWGGGKANAHTLSLAPLSDVRDGAALHALLDRAVLPAVAQAGLLARAGGNPLYAEQFVRMVAERGTDVSSNCRRPCRAIIAARLDALPPADKELLQDAAVVGKVFWLGALAAIGGRDA